MTFNSVQSSTAMHICSDPSTPPRPPAQTFGVSANGPGYERLLLRYLAGAETRSSSWVPGCWGSKMSAIVFPCKRKITSPIRLRSLAAPFSLTHLIVLLFHLLSSFHCSSSFPPSPLRTHNGRSSNFNTKRRKLRRKSKLTCSAPPLGLATVSEPRTHAHRDISHSPPRPEYSASSTHSTSHNTPPNLCSRLRRLGRSPCCCRRYRTNCP